MRVPFEWTASWSEKLPVGWMNNLLQAEEKSYDTWLAKTFLGQILNLTLRKAGSSKDQQSNLQLRHATSISARQLSSLSPLLLRSSAWLERIAVRISASSHTFFGQTTWIWTKGTYISTALNLNLGNFNFLKFCVPSLGAVVLYCTVLYCTVF